MLTVQNVLLIFGLILIASAIFGGGFTIRGIRIPEISLVPRVLAALVGAGFVAVALNYDSQSSGETSDVPNPRLERAVIEDQLGNRQTRAHLDVDIDGQRVGRIELTSESRTDRVEIEPTNRVVRYLLYGEEVTRLGPDLIERRLAGGGTIALAPGSQFCVRTLEPRGGSDRSVSNVMLVPIAECYGGRTDSGGVAVK